MQFIHLFYFHSEFKRQERSSKNLGDRGSESGISQYPDPTPLSPSTAQRQRNVRISNEKEERAERARVVGASMSAETLLNMRSILDEIGATEVNRYDSHSDSDYDYESERVRERERSGSSERVRERSGSGERVRVHAPGDPGPYLPTHLPPRSASAPPRPRPHPHPPTDAKISTSSHRPFSHSDHSDRRDDSPHPGPGQSNDNLEKAEYEESLFIAETEMRLLRESLKAEREANELLQAQLTAAMDVDPDFHHTHTQESDDRAYTGTNTVSGSGTGGGTDYHTDMIRANNVGQKTYSTFMQETADEIKIPDGEGNRIALHFI